MIEFLKPVLFVIEIVIGLGLVIFLHEAGHFLMAKKNRVRVEIFSLGFGQALWKRKWGETEYRIAWIPLGGYVKMAGESFAEERTGKPDELTSKTAWQRFQIFVAGALTNLIIAFPISILAFWFGRYDTSAEVGVPAVPETYAGMRPGDVVVEVDGVPIESGDKYRFEMVSQRKGKKVPVKVRREGQIVSLEVEQGGSEALRSLPPWTTLGKLAPDSEFAKAGLKEGDEIVEVDGKRVFHHAQILEALRDKSGREVPIVARRPKNEGREFDTFSTRVFIEGKKVRRFPEEARLRPPVVGEGVAGYPAAGKLEENDEIFKIDSTPIKSFQDLKDAVGGAVGKTLLFHVHRKGADLTVDIRPTYGEEGIGKIGMKPKESKVIADLDEGGFYYKQGLRSKDEIVSVAGTVGDVGVKDITVSAIPAGENTLRLEVQRGGQRVKLELVPEEKEECDVSKFGVHLNDKGEPEWTVTQIFRRRSFVDGLKEGVREPVAVGRLTVQLIIKLLSGEESKKGLAGPVGIAQASYRSAEASTGNFLWLLCLITVNLGIFNLLPIPILDGGHVVLLAIEKLRGKPPGEKFIAIFQYAGLVFLLALIIFVTYNDIGRLLPGRHG